MDEIHRMMRDVPVPIYALMVGIPLLMSAAAIAVGWYAREQARRRAAESPSGRRSPQSDALPAAVTVAIVPFAFAILMLWGRFG
ncbi:MAG: hypothetical protein R2708_00605 [Vicinamibacterales bacterium]|jgi:hypothetical protein